MKTHANISTQIFKIQNSFRKWINPYIWQHYEYMTTGQKYFFIMGEADWMPKNY